MYRGEDLDQEVPYIYHPEESLPPLSVDDTRLSESMKVAQQTEKLSLYQNDDKVSFDTQDLFQDLSQMQEHWMREGGFFGTGGNFNAQATKEDQFVPDVKNASPYSAERSKKQLVQTDYGPVQIKIEDDNIDDQYHASDCMIKNSIFCKKETEDETGGIRMPEPMIPDSGHLSPSNVNIPLLSPRHDDSYQIPSPCQIDYIENARSPIYLPQGQNNYSKPHNGDIDMRSNTGMYHMHPADFARTSSFPPSNRLNHDYAGQNHLFDAIKSEMRDDNRAAYAPSPQMKPPSSDYPVSRFDHRFKHRYHYPDRFSPYKEHCENHHNRPYHRRGTLQLWQFLVSLLAEKDCQQYIAWVGRGLEFKLIDPEEVARRWGIQKNRPAMNYDKLSRSLRYYYEKGIMQKVAGERYVYRFVCNPEALFSLAFPDGMRPLLKPQCCQPQRVTDQQLIAGTRDAYTVSSYMSTPSAFSRYPDNWVKTPETAVPTPTYQQQ